MDKEKQIERNCDNCKRQHTRYCPNSSECISLPNLPYFETDVIRLLEHDWDMHEKEIAELQAENEKVLYDLSMTEGIVREQNNEIDELKSEINGLQGKCDALEQDKSNLERTLEQLREQYELAGCSLDGYSETIESLSLENEELKAENERLTKELAIANRALELFFEYADHFIQSKQMFKDGYRSRQEYWKDKAKKELEEQDK